MAASMKQNLEHVSKDRGTVRRVKYRGWEGGRGNVTTEGAK